jgi:hypothetical protein
MGTSQEGAVVCKAGPDDKYANVLCSRPMLLLDTIPVSQILLGSSFIPLLRR